jgi:hypothetical protein
MTLSRHTTEVEADRAANALIEVVHWLQGGAA